MAAISRATHAISFQLLNKDGQSVLGIFDPQKGQTSSLELINSSRRNWKLKTLTGAPSATNHHFELKFRSDTLSLTGTPAITVDADAARWKISSPVPTEGGVSLYLLSESPFELKSGTKATVKLNNLNAAGTGGGRGTRVELKWGGNLEYSNSTGPTPDPWVAGHRVQHLTLVNQRGEQNIPLHVGFSPTNQVLNNGTVNELKLQITNAMTQGSINVIPQGDPEFQATEFKVSFESSANKWTLAPLDAVKQFEIKASLEGRELKVRKEEQGQTISWIIWADRLPRLALNPGKSIDVTISNVKTSYLSGPTNLYLHYKNIPGYWDGDFVSIIEKGPFVYRDKGVGVGTNDPQTKLHVKGTTRLEGDASIENGNLSVGTTTTRKKLSVNGDLRVEDEISVGGGHAVKVDAPGVPAGRFYVTTDGDVGIGTADPKSKLHVNGDVRVAKDKEIYFVDNGQIRSHDDAHRILFRREGYNVLELREYGHIVFSPGSEQGAETAKMIIRNTGRVGIGTDDPSTHLHIKGAGDQEVMIESSDDNGAKWSLQSSAGAQDGRFEIINRSSGQNHFTILKDGRIGIGTVGPTKAKLEVSGWVGGSIGTFAYMNGSVFRSGGTSSPNDYSIWASNRIAALEFNAFSDERVKNIQGRSDSAMDLSTLLGIEITDYSHRDVIAKGNGACKKVIGQQIEKIYPQAVTKVTDVVPDIYQPAFIKDGWVALATDLKTGDRVKLITENSESIHEVLEATPDKFRVDFSNEDDQVFVFGREVNDFLTVDYDAISMLNVSATQQLKKELDHEVNALRVENAELRAANDALAKRLQLLESKLEAVLGVMSATNGSNGNGRHAV